MTATLADPPPSHELTLERRLNAPRAALWRCWTEPDLLAQWFTPAPWTTQDVEIDLRSGGTFSMTMKGPNGESHPSSGVYLEVVPGARLVFTDAYLRAWVPSAKPFFTGVISFEDDGDGTRYVARARHWTAEDKDAHSAMGFHEGWGKAADQLEALAKRL